MFRKIKDVIALQDMKVSVQFANGTTKIYDVARLIDKIDAFIPLQDKTLFNDVRVDVGGYGIVWNDDLDLSCDELWENGVEVKMPFDSLMSFSDASELWGLSESTLRKAISYGKLVAGMDARKYGKQWVVTRKAMTRGYGDPAAPPIEMRQA